MTEQPAANFAEFDTHEVFNQPPALADYNLYETDRVLRDIVKREGAGWADNALIRAGAEYGRAEAFEWGALANRYLPVLQTFDRFGHRRDEVEFHPAWHEMMRLAVRHGLHTSPWAEPKAGSHVARAAAYYLHGQVECGTLCPTTMTYGSVPALQKAGAMASDWMPRLLSRDYDKRFRPVHEKTGALVGMGMTEKQGGSDVRSNTTRAEPVGKGGPGGEYRVTGHKWFMSAPMCDGFLILAQAPGGLTCFLLPRFTPGGDLNRIRIQRLKEKLGNKSNASSEVEFHGATAFALGEEGRGIPTILEMGTYTRLDCALGTTSCMRQALSQAMHHASYRTAFQRHLIDQPLMRNVLADLAVEWEAATLLSFRLARAFDRQEDAQEADFRRIMTPVSKYWICKRGPYFAFEAMEALGGNGYVEESIMGRIYREMPVNSIWEGSGNIMCLDVLRACDRSPQSLATVFAEMDSARGADKRLDRFIDALKDDFGRRGVDRETGARRLTEGLALGMQASLLSRFSPAAVTDAFISSRIAQSGSGRAFGTLPDASDFSAIINRALPH